MRREEQGATTIPAAMPEGGGRKGDRAPAIRATEAILHPSLFIPEHV